MWSRLGLIRARTRILASLECNVALVRDAVVLRAVLVLHLVHLAQDVERAGQVRDHAQRRLRIPHLVEQAFLEAL